MTSSFIKTEDISSVILDFIGSKEFEDIGATMDISLGDFMGVLGIASCVILSKTPKYYATEKSDVGSDAT